MGYKSIINKVEAGKPVYLYSNRFDYSLGRYVKEAVELFKASNRKNTYIIRYVNNITNEPVTDIMTVRPFRSAVKRLLKKGFIEFDKKLIGLPL